jgi:hyaluronoglucosaminidase
VKAETMVPELGVIEGYFGKPWRHEDRKRVLTRLRELGYSWFHHAPKADAYLRRRWREPHPPAAFAELADLSAHCRSLGMRFGIGLSPYELYREDTGAARADFLTKLRALDEIGIDDLAILFDDTRGDVPDLAAREAEIVHAALAATRASRVVMCPTYYSDDRMLDVVFGQRPPGYLDDLGRRLDPRVGVYWTGEEICAREIGVGHLARVAESLRRKPTLWDNYPVNDGPQMSRFLHLRGFTGRPRAIGPHLAAHAINPALQPHLSLIPAATLVASYRQGPAYAYMQAFREAAHTLAGAELAPMLEEDLRTLQDLGLDRLGNEHQRLRQRYLAVNHPMAAEVVRWLDGADTVDSWVDEPNDPP